MLQHRSHIRLCASEERVSFAGGCGKRKTGYTGALCGFQFVIESNSTMQEVRWCWCCRLLMHLATIWVHWLPDGMRLPVEAKQQPPAECRGCTGQRARNRCVCSTCCRKRIRRISAEGIFENVYEMDAELLLVFTAYASYFVYWYEYQLQFHFVKSVPTVFT